MKKVTWTSKEEVLFPLIPGFWLVFFLLAPMFIVTTYAFLTRGLYGGVQWALNIQNFIRLFDPLYLQVFVYSFVLASLTTLFCLLLGIPLALWMASAPKHRRLLLLLLVVIPFWTSFVVRAYAIRLLVSSQGPINDFLLSVGLVNEPVTMTATFGLVMVGMIVNYLPFMVLPLFVSFDRLDFSMLEAAYDLGASRWRGFWRVLLPNVRAGLVSGIFFVFIPALGEFVLPDILGGARTMLLGNLITEQFLKSRDWPFGAAISLGLMLLAIVAFVIEQWVNHSAEKLQKKEVAL